MGATLIAASIIVLVIGLSWLNRGGDGRERLAVPMVDGVTPPTAPDGEVLDIPPSQPAVPVSFGQDGHIVRTEPDRARIVDEQGNEVIVALPPGTTVDTVTGRIVTRPGGGSTTSPAGGTSTSTGGSSSTRPTDPDTTPSTRDTTTTTSPSSTEPHPTTSSTEPSTTSSTTPPTSDDDDGGGGDDDTTVP